MKEKFSYQQTFWDEFWLGVYQDSPTIGVSFTILGQTTAISTAGASVSISPTTLFGASIDIQSMNPKSNVEVGAGLNKHLGIGTYPGEKGRNPYVVHIGGGVGLPVTGSVKLVGTDWKNSDTSGVIKYFMKAGE